MKIISILSLVLSAFLLFYVQPFFGRLVLPYFGSAASVWVTCLAFFQVVLLLGYLYTYFISRLKIKTQSVIHILVLAVCTIMTVRLLDISGFKEAASIAGASLNPTLSLLSLLALWVGPAYFVIATNSPLMQSWISKVTIQDRRVYRLYAVSNIGSFIGLFSYPVIVEPYAAITDQTVIFITAFCVYAVLTVLSGIMLLFFNKNIKNNAELKMPLADKNSKNPKFLFFLVFCIAAATTLLLMGITQHLSVDLPPMPLMWSLLLGLYLLSFVVGFSQSSIRILPLLVLLSAILIVLEGYLSTRPLNAFYEYMFKVISSSATLFITAAALNTWLYKLRPSEDKLTGYYFMMSLGGAVSGVFVSIVAPLVFTSLLEYPTSLFISGLMLVWYIVYEAPVEIAAVSRIIFLVPVSVIVFNVFVGNKTKTNEATIWRGRSFYGSLSISEDKPKLKTGNEVIVRTLRHGSTLHGTQCLGNNEDRIPLSYYSTYTGLGHYIAYMTNQSARPVSVGLVGLGAGTTAAYGREGDSYTFYEIDPLVKEIAYNPAFFTYISDSPADINVVLGDARVSLEKELKSNGSKGYDLLAIDAFSSDSIPMHLITKEAVELYLSHVKDSGAVAVHISNRYINLRPIMKAIGNALNINTYVYASNQQGLKTAAEWVIYTKEPTDFLPQPTVSLDNMFSLKQSDNISSGRIIKLSSIPDVKPWTDDFHSIIPFLGKKR